MPEGLAVALPLLGLGYSRWKAFSIAALTGLVEPIGGILGASAVTVFHPIMPFALAFAAGAMPQLILPLIPPGATRINDLVNVYREENLWTYFVNLQPIFSHPADDVRMFRLITSQLIDSGACRQVDILKAFGVSKSNVDRSLQTLREKGADAFFTPRKRRSGGQILTQNMLAKAQNFLDQGYSRREVSDDLGIKYDTLRKAINDGRLSEQKPSKLFTTKSIRNEKDAIAADGMGTASGKSWIV